MKNLLERNNVSRETYLKLRAYEASLVEWQKKFNLVSNASLVDAWERHFIDSIQLLPLIPEDSYLMYDFGSGAGFPGMVLAIILNERTPYLKIKLIESTKKKTLYLNYIAELCRLSNVEIINDRIENIKPEKADVITSRAMTNLNNLLGYAVKFSSRKTKCIFPKGQKYAEEIAEAEKKWKFEYELINSETSEEGKIITITNIREKGKENAKNNCHSKS